MRLWASISHHGLGHLAQTAPILYALHGQAAAIVVQSALPLARLQARLPQPFVHNPEAAETAFVMFDALRVDVAASRAAFAAFHHDWPQRVDALARELERQRVDVVLANVAYLPLAAAARVGLRAYAVCSLNWADIYAHYVGRDTVWQTMLEAYAGARSFFRPTPAMPMPWLENAETVGVLAQPGVNRRGEMAERLKLDNTRRMWLVGMGGFGWEAAPDLLPQRPNTVWLLPDDWPAGHNDMYRFSQAGMDFADVLASCDGLFTKPGYGSFAEAATQGLDVLYLSRPDWPESPALTDWLHANTRARAVMPQRADLAKALDDIAAQPKPPRPTADGAATIRTRFLGRA